MGRGADASLENRAEAAAGPTVLQKLRALSPLSRRPEAQPLRTKECNNEAACLTAGARPRGLSEDPWQAVMCAGLEGPRKFSARKLQLQCARARVKAPSATPLEPNTANAGLGKALERANSKKAVKAAWEAVHAWQKWQAAAKSAVEQACGQEEDTTRLIPAPAAAEAEYVSQAFEERGQEGQSPPTDVNEAGRTELHQAACAGDLKRVHTLLKNKADLHAEDKFGNTPLHLAARYGHPAVLKLLLRCGANLHQADEYGGTTLLWAAYGGSTDCVHMLLEKGADVKTKDQGGCNSVLLAAMKGHMEVCQMLLEYGADGAAVDKAGRTPVTVARDGGYTRLVALLQDHLANSAKPSSGWWGWCLEVLSPSKPTGAMEYSPETTGADLDSLFDHMSWMGGRA